MTRNVNDTTAAVLDAIDYQLVLSDMSDEALSDTLAEIEAWCCWLRSTLAEEGREAAAQEVIANSVTATP